MKGGFGVGPTINPCTKVSSANLKSGDRLELITLGESFAAGSLGMEPSPRNRVQWGEVKGPSN